MGGEALVLNRLYFFCGTLRHLPLLEIVLGHPVVAEPAWLADHALYCATDSSFPAVVPQPGARAEGILLRVGTDLEVARLDFFEGGFGFSAHPMQVMQQGGAVEALVFHPEPLGHKPALGAPWRLQDWQAQYGAEFEAMARDYLALFGVKPPRAVAARFEQMLTRGASRVRAGRAGAVTLRHNAVAADVAVAARREPYARFFAIEEVDISFRRFDGSMSPQVTRAGFIASDAVTVLPYDPVRDRVLVVDQFRAGPYLRGDPQPWQIEAIAGRIDSGETPIEAARREAVEEAGLVLDDLLPIASYYPSPGCSSEYLYSFVALTDLPDAAAGVFGVEGEAEDIRGHLLSFARLMELVTSGEISNAPTLLSALWLAQNRDRLRKA
ncbi:tellurite resistance protein [Cypionkella aquatica]|uniref:ADP-ribose pyrophosphatase n=1 Tax=Cypionkella aquatica TaxID=1756042 RepID=A0AA37U7M4_9RHOB|nr:gamma-glutamylcyclotransferase [Cypionkella aquatica]GLS88345.1 tellurite resistance protein [Cypionkella aquatica]